MIDIKDVMTIVGCISGKCALSCAKPYTKTSYLVKGGRTRKKCSVFSFHFLASLKLNGQPFLNEIQCFPLHLRKKVVLRSGNGER